MKKAVCCRILELQRNNIANRKSDDNWSMNAAIENFTRNQILYYGPQSQFS